jgi:hypothetical protein
MNRSTGSHTSANEASFAKVGRFKFASAAWITKSADPTVIGRVLHA